MMANQDVSQAMVLSRCQNNHALWAEWRQAHNRTFGKSAAQLRQHFGRLDRAVEFGAHIKSLRRRIDKLLVADDVDPAAEKYSSDAMDQARTVLALHQEDVAPGFLSICVRHCWAKACAVLSRLAPSAT